MDEEFNPFRSPETPPPTPSYPVPKNLYMGPIAALYASGHTRAIFAIAMLGLVAVFNSACGAMHVRRYELRFGDAATRPNFASLENLRRRLWSCGGAYSSVASFHSLEGACRQFDCPTIRRSI
jgi:hypothetical protein